MRRKALVGILVCLMLGTILVSVGGEKNDLSIEIPDELPNGAKIIDVWNYKEDPDAKEDIESLFPHVANAIIYVYSDCYIAVLTFNSITDLQRDIKDFATYVGDVNRISSKIIPNAWGMGSGDVIFTLDEKYVVWVDIHRAPYNRDIEIAEMVYSLNKPIASAQGVLKIDEDRSYVLNLNTGTKTCYADFLNTDQSKGDELEFRIYVSKTGVPIPDDYVLELRTNMDKPRDLKFGDEVYHSSSVVVWQGKAEHEYPFPSPIILTGVVPEPIRQVKEPGFEKYNIGGIGKGEVYVELTVGTSRDGVTLETIQQKLSPSMVFYSTDIDIQAAERAINDNLGEARAKIGETDLERDIKLLYDGGHPGWASILSKDYKVLSAMVGALSATYSSPSLTPDRLFLASGTASAQDVLKIDEHRSYVRTEEGEKIPYENFLNTDQYEGAELEFHIYVSKTEVPIPEDYVLELRTNMDKPRDWKFGDEIYHSSSVVVWQGKAEHEYPFPSPIILTGAVPEPIKQVKEPGFEKYNIVGIGKDEVYVELTVGTSRDGVTLETIQQKLSPSMVFYSTDIGIQDAERAINDNLRSARAKIGETDLERDIKLLYEGGHPGWASILSKDYKAVSAMVGAPPTTPPSPTVSSDTYSLSMSVGETKVITFTVSNTGGESDTDSYLSVSVSSGLQIEEWSSSSTDINFVYSPVGSEIRNSVENQITSEYELLDAYEAYSAGETNTVTIKVKTTAIGSQWIKYRTAFDTVESGYNFIRNPTSGPVDQQGWQVYVIPVSIGTSEEEYIFVTMWPELPQSWYFDSPEGIAVDGSGYVYVADTRNHRIQKFDAEGNFITQWGSRGTGEGELHLPEGIAVDSSGNVFVADFGNARIQKFDSFGNFITKWGSEGTGDGEFDGPADIAIDSSGNVFVDDFYNHRIQKFDSFGNFITKWGVKGTGNGEFYRPEGIAVDSSGNVFVADTYFNHRIQKFDSNGNFITKWGKEGTGDGKFYYPRGIVVDSRGNVFVADSGNHRIQKFNSNGNFITKWGVKGIGNGEFDWPFGIAVDSSGYMYVADRGNDRIQKLDSNGNFITKWGSYGTSNGEFYYPMGIAIDSRGNVFVVDTINNRTQKFDSNGNFITKWGGAGTGAGEFDVPSGIAIDSRGNVYVVDAGNDRIQKFDSNGNFITKWGVEGMGSGEFGWPHIAVDGRGNVFVADSGNHRIQKFDSVGNFITEWGVEGTGDGEFYYPSGIAVDSRGNVFVADLGNSRIQKFDSYGNFIIKWGSSGTGDGEFDYHTGVAVDRSGNVFVADLGNHRIQEFDSFGNFITTWGSYGTGDGEFYYPGGIAVDSRGNVFVADSGNHRIQKFAPGIPTYSSPTVSADTSFLSMSVGENKDITFTVSNNGGESDTESYLSVSVSRGLQIEEWSSSSSDMNFKYSSVGSEIVNSVGNQITSEYELLDAYEAYSAGETNTVSIKVKAIASGSQWIKYRTAFDTLDSGYEFIRDPTSGPVDQQGWHGYEIPVSTGTSEEEYTFVTLWPELPQPWYFFRPSGIVVDSSGNVFVAEFYSNRIQKFDADGNFITKWGSYGTGDGQFDGPCSIAVDSSDNVFVSDFGNVQIQKFDSFGNFITKWGSPGTGDGEFDHPSGIAIDSSGNVFVADFGNHRIQKFDPCGDFITQWGSYGTGDEEFNPGDIAVDSRDHVYVGDYGNNRIQKFDSFGNFITKWGSYGTGDGEFDSLEGIAVDSSGNVFVADSFNDRIQKFDSFGNFITKWGSEGTGDGEFDSLEGITVDSRGNVFVADSFNDRIQKFDPYGSFITKWSSQGTGDGEFDWPVSIAVDGSSNVFVADSGNDRIQKFDSFGNFITKWGGYGTGDGEFDHPSGIAVDSSAHVYVADNDNKRIQKFDSFGNFITKWGSPGTGEGEFNRPEGIAVDSSGNVFVVDWGNNRIQKFDSHGNFITLWGSRGSGDGEFYALNDIAVDSRGNVYVADWWNDRIQKFDSFGNFITKWGSRGTGEGEFYLPTGIAVDRSGNVYVADRNNNRIQKFDPCGDFITQWGNHGSGDGEFDLPMGIAVDSNGNVFVADTRNNRIQKFVPGIPKLPDWTFMVYMGADNSMKGDANIDVKEIEEAGSTDEVNIVYLLDKTNSNTIIYRITGDHESEPKKEYTKNKNSGDPNTLKDFINWVGSNYPAQHYCLVVWDHGYGWKGVVMDETEKEDKITLEELKNALDTSKIDKFDVIGFDACLMGGVEVDYQIKENSDYIVHSEETIEKGGGWPYDEILKSLISNPGMDGRELSETIVDKYAGYYQDEYYKATVSAVDTSRLDTLIDTIDIFSTKLLDKLEEGKGGKISAVRDSTDYYARGISDHKVHNIFIDLYDFAEKIKEEFAEDEDLMDVSTDITTAMAGENGVVIKHWSESHGEHREDSHGLSIYFTKEDSDFRKYDSKYDDIEFSKDTRWDDFLRGYLQMKVDAKCPIDLILVDLEGNTTDIDTTTLTVTKHSPPANSIKGDLLKALEQAEYFKESHIRI